MTDQVPVWEEATAVETAQLRVLVLLAGHSARTLINALINTLLCFKQWPVLPGTGGLEGKLRTAMDANMAHVGEFHSWTMDSPYVPQRMAQSIPLVLHSILLGERSPFLSTLELLEKWWTTTTFDSQGRAIPMREAVPSGPRRVFLDALLPLVTVPGFGTEGYALPKNLGKSSDYLNDRRFADHPDLQFPLPEDVFCGPKGLFAHLARHIPALSRQEAELAQRREL